MQMRISNLVCGSPVPAPGTALVVVLWLLVVGCGLAAACGARPSAPAPVRVFAAASLAVPFAELARRFEAEHPELRIELHTAGTPQLVLQLREGAPADVFAAAAPEHMAQVAALGLLAGAAQEFARNHLAIAVAPGNPHGIRGLADLTRADLRVALCGPEVPAGRYARAALAKAAVVVASRSDEPSVVAVVTKVQLGELDAGIVYTTDVRSPLVQGIALPSEHDQVASYPIAALAKGGAPGGAAAFVSFVTGPVGRSVLQNHGFEVP
jgi:molybdate transport system substrate-binding protein